MAAEPAKKKAGRPPGKTPAKTPAERQQATQAALARSGGKRLAINLPADTVRHIAVLQGEWGTETETATVLEAIKRCANHKRRF